MSPLASIAEQPYAAQPESATYQAVSGLAPQVKSTTSGSGGTGSIAHQGGILGGEESDTRLTRGGTGRRRGDAPPRDAPLAERIGYATGFGIGYFGPPLVGAYIGAYISSTMFRWLARRQLRRLLKAVVPALRTAGVTFWVDFGTLMGLYMKDDVYDGDNDTSVVILQPDFEHLIEVLPQLLPKEYTVQWCGNGQPLGDGLVQEWLRVLAPGRLHWINMYGGYQMGDKIQINKGPECALPAPMVLPLGRVRMMGSDAPAPRDIEMVLRTRYGPDWYAYKGKDSIEHHRRCPHVVRALGRIGLRM